MERGRLVYDDDCGFCTWWAEFFDRRAPIAIVGFSDLDPELRGRLPENYEDCSHFVTDEAVYSCGASIEQALLRTGFGVPARPVLRRLERIDGYESLRERGYRTVADSRDVWGRLLSRTPPVRRGDEESSDSSR